MSSRTGWAELSNSQPAPGSSNLGCEISTPGIGPATEGRRWHGREFTTTLRAALAEAYGISGVGARSSYHGVYAEAIEARIAAPGRQQAPLPLAASG